MKKQTLSLMLAMLMLLSTVYCALPALCAEIDVTEPDTDYYEATPTDGEEYWEDVDDWYDDDEEWYDDEEEWYDDEEEWYDDEEEYTESSPEDNVTDVTVKQVTAIKEGDSCYLDCYYDEYIDNFEFTVSFNDGTSVTGTRDYIYNSTDVYICINDDRDENPWSEGEHTATLSVGEITKDFTVTISPSDIAEITVSDIKTVSEKNQGRYIAEVDSEYDEETDDWIQIYNEKWVINTNAIDFVFTVKYRDNTAKSFRYSGTGVEYGGYEIEAKDEQGNWWDDFRYYDLSESNTLSFTYRGKSFTVTIPLKDRITDDNRFEYVEQNGKAYITRYNGAQETVTVPSEINGLTVAGILSFSENQDTLNEYTVKLIIPDTVTAISADAFSAFSELEEIQLGKSVKGITAEHFLGCSRLEKITVANGNKTYVSVDGVLYDKAKTKIVAYPNSASREVTIPDTVSDINALFSITKYDISISSNNPYFTEENGVVYNKDKSVIYFCNSDKSGSYTMPDSVKEVKALAFYECDKLESVTVSDNVTAIVYGTFYGCDNLKTVSLSPSVKTVDEKAFSDSGLTEINLSDVTEIGNEAFSYTKLANADLSSSNSIGESAFYGCEKLTKVKLGNSLTEIKNRTFCATGIKTITLPNSITEIGMYAFSYSDLTKISLPDSVKTLGEYAFYDCNKLTDVSFGKSLTEIPAECFRDCDSLRKIVLPANITAVGYKAFCDSLILNDITVENPDCDINQLAFYNTGTTVINIDGKEIFEGTSAEKTGKNTYAYPEGVTDIVYGEFYERFCNYYDVKTGSTDVTETVYETIDYDKIRVTSIPDSVTHISTGTFESIKISDVEGNLAYIGNALIRSEGANEDGKYTVRDGTRIIADGVFREELFENEIKSVTLPDSLEIIGNCVFLDTPIESIKLPKNLKSIGDFAFYGTSLTSINIPANVESIGEYAFSGTGIKTVTVASGNKNFKVVDGILYTADMRELVYCPTAKTGDVKIPESVIKIRDGAFGECDNVDNIYLPFRMRDNTSALILAKISYFYYDCGIVGDRYYSFNGSCNVNVIRGSKYEKVLSDVGYNYNYYESDYTDLVIGDVDADGKIASSDARLALRASVGLENFNARKLMAADIDCDGKMSSADARLILRASVGLEISDEW